MIALPANLQWAIVGVYGLLIISSILVFLLTQVAKDKNFQELIARMKTWWIMVIIFSLAMILSKKVSLIFLSLVSFLALKEYLSLIPTRRADRRVLFWCYASIFIQSYIIYTAWYGLFIIFIPIYVFLFLPFRMITIGETKGFLNAIGTLHWGLMTTVYSLGHAAFLLMLPVEVNSQAGPVGLLFFLVLLTQLNDIAQYCWGKLLGKSKIIPKVSLGKTTAGFIGGVLTTTGVAVLVAPYLTPLSLERSIMVGASIGIAGFIGDVTISAIKRDIGVKDSGTLLPGHGGILDRIDSLTYTAPLFFHFIHYFYI